MLENELLGLHFTKNEIKVYLALFEFGKVRAGEIIEKTGLHRNIVYTALDELVHRKLITKTLIKGVATFVTNSPEALVSEVENKKQLAEHIAKELKQKKEQDHLEVAVYEGMEGVKRSRNKILLQEKNETLYVLNASTESSTPEYEKYWRYFHKKREAKGINLKILYEHGIRKEDIAWREKLPLAQVKYLPFGLKSPVWFSAIGDLLEIGVPGKDPLVFNIRSKEAADGIKQYFEYLWKQDIIVDTGFEALRKCFQEMLDELDKGEEYFVLGASLGPNSTEIQKFYDTFHKDRIKKGVVTNMLTYEDSYELIKKRFEDAGDPELKISKLKKFSTIPPIPMQINMYKGKTRFIIYGEEPTVIYFDRKEVFGSFKNYFDYLWNQEVQTYTGWQEVNNLFNNIVLHSLDLDDSEYVIGAGYGEDSANQKVRDLFDEHSIHLVQNKVHKYILSYEQHRKKFQEDIAKPGKEGSTYMHIRYLPDTYAAPVEIHIYNKRAVVTYFGENPVSTVYEHPKIIENYKKQFDLLWQIAKK